MCGSRKIVFEGSRAVVVFCVPYKENTLSYIETGESFPFSFVFSEQVSLTILPTTQYLQVRVANCKQS